MFLCSSAGLAPFLFLGASPQRASREERHMANARRPALNDAPDTNSTAPAAANKQLGIRVPVELSDRLESIARREHNGISAVCRRLLASALADHDNEAA